MYRQRTWWPSEPRICGGWPSACFSMVFFKCAPISHSLADWARIEEFQKIVKNPLNGRQPLLPETSAIIPYALIDMAVFTLGLHENDSIELVSQPLIDRYKSIMHFATCTQGGVAHMQLERSEHDQQSDQDEPRIRVLHQARHLLDLPHSADPRLVHPFKASPAPSRFRYLLGPTVRCIDLVSGHWRSTIAPRISEEMVSDAGCAHGLCDGDGAEPLRNGT